MRTDDAGPEIIASRFQEELDKGNVDKVRIAERYVYGEFKIAPEVPAAKGEDGKPASDEKTEPEKLPKEFKVVRPTDAGWVVNLENELKAKGV